ncbi:unnamed protein product [Spirodela intermedia]|uniref:Uncharacterized protein n=1 Tax=Spirodela intermedia TaxID=51605 RepID=A0A7I8JN97_SPIIN|nr:unnamed protein product [Spirodela intermedia]CAA6671265.1 unnamed protein product [Spirodela intermedia]
MSWLRHKLYRYEVTIGLYGLEWWERYIFNTMVLMLLWFTCSKMLKTSAHVYDWAWQVARTYWPRLNRQ